MDAIKVQTQVGSATSAVAAEVLKIEVKKESEAASNLRKVLKADKLLGNHTYSIAQLVGIYPA